MPGKRTALESNAEQPRTAKSKRTTSNNKICSFPGCSDLVKAKRRCLAHDLRTRCCRPNCSAFAQSKGKCLTHGGGRRCSHPGCDSSARSKGLCGAHGGGKLCSYPDCTTRARLKGKCHIHGGAILCSSPECTKTAKINSKCVGHGGLVWCSESECNKQAKKGGKCVAHGGGTRCSIQDCTQHALTGGKCFQHGGGNRCSNAQCSKQARKKGGFCSGHGGGTQALKGGECDRESAGADVPQNEVQLRMLSVRAAKPSLVSKKVTKVIGSKTSKAIKKTRQTKGTDVVGQRMKCSYPYCRKPIWENTKCFDHNQPTVILPKRTRLQHTAILKSENDLVVNQKMEGTSSQTAEEVTNAKLPASTYESAGSKTARRKRASKKKDSKVTTSTENVEENSAGYSTATGKTKRTVTCEPDAQRNKRQCVGRQVLLESDEVGQNGDSAASYGTATHCNEKFILSEVVKIPIPESTNAHVEDVKSELVSDTDEEQHIPESETETESITDDNGEHVELKPMPEADDEQPRTDSELAELTKSMDDEAKLDFVSDTEDEQQRPESETETVISGSDEHVKLELVSESDDEQTSPDSETDEALKNEGEMKSVLVTSEERGSKESEMEDTAMNDNGEYIIEELVSVMGVLVPLSAVPDRLKGKMASEGEDLSDEENVPNCGPGSDLQRKSTRTKNCALADHQAEDIDSDESECFY